MPLRFYRLFINTRVLNKRTKPGSIYFENINSINIRNMKAKVTWFIKKKGTNCGIWYLIINNKARHYYIYIYIYIYIYFFFDKNFTPTELIFIFNLT